MSNGTQQDRWAVSEQLSALQDHKIVIILLHGWLWWGLSSTTLLHTLLLIWTSEFERDLDTRTLQYLIFKEADTYEARGVIAGNGMAEVTAFSAMILILLLIDITISGVPCLDTWSSDYQSREHSEQMLLAATAIGELLHISSLLVPRRHTESTDQRPTLSIFEQHRASDQTTAILVCCHLFGFRSD